MRTDGAKRVRIANRLSGMHVSAKSETLGAWSKSKTEAVVCDAKRALQMQERGASSRNNKTLSRISKFTAFTKKFHPLPEVEGKCAFTLAEVLITLGVIGVVAALTLPSVIAKYQDKVLINQTKKTFAQFQNVLSLASVDNGTPGDNSLTFPKDVSSTIVTKNLAKYYNVAQVCTSASQKGCSKYYYKILFATPQSNNAGEAVYSNFDTYLNRLVTVDGAVFAISSNRTGCERIRYAGTEHNDAGEIIYNPDGTPKTYEYYSAICANIQVDVNGAKGPNQYGRDVFYLWVNANNLNYNTGTKLGGDSLKNIFSGKDELVYTKYQVPASKN